MKKRLFTTLLAFTLLFIISISAYADSGTIFNPYDNEPVVSMWVEVKDGDSGWAKLTKSGTGKPNEVRWSFDTQGKNWDAHIGIGGDPGNWDNTYKSGWVNKHGSGINLYPVQTSLWWIFGTKYAVVVK